MTQLVRRLLPPMLVPRLPYPQTASGRMVDRCQRMVAFCVPTVADAYVQFLVDDFKAYYQQNAPNVTVEVGDAGGNAERQISQIENYVAMGAKQIVVLPVNPFGMETVIEQSRAKGVHIMFLGIKPEVEIDLFTGLDNGKTR